MSVHLRLLLWSLTISTGFGKHSSRLASGGLTHDLRVWLRTWRTSSVRSSRQRHWRILNWTKYVSEGYITRYHGGCFLNLQKTYPIHRVVGDNVGFLLKAFKNELVIPEFDTFCKQVRPVFLVTYLLEHVYRGVEKRLKFLLSRTKAEPGRTVEEEQEQVSPNHG